ncbi:MAG TPA: acyl-CoA dehydrogenase C-terminal domain-containing protein, partial [Candidatus Nitrosotenuis sp.]|nr:acyl-CoA dehydrogenase C-terminal domain-containing protein [Candidatus Nitrosotenuis sp.]
VQEFIDQHQDDESLAEFIGPLAKAFGRLQQATLTVAQRGLSDPEEAGAAATDYLRFFALVALAYLWCRAVIVARSRLGQGEDEFYQGKILTARFFMQKILPQTSSLLAIISAGAKPVMEMPDTFFGAEL